MELMTVEEAAVFLKMHKHTLSEKARLKEIPCAKPGRRYVFIKEDLITWLRAQYTQEIELCRSDYEVTPIGSTYATRSLGGALDKLRELREKTKPKNCTTR